MLIRCPGCEFVFDHSSTDGKCPRCGLAADLPEGETAPETVLQRLPEPSTGTRMRLVDDPPAPGDIPGDTPAAGDDAPCSDEDARVEHLPGPSAMAPLRIRFLASLYDNLQVGLFFVFPSAVAELILRYWAGSLPRPSTFQEALVQMDRVNTAAGWMALVVAVFGIGILYYLQIHVPLQHGRTKGQRRYGLSLEKKDGAFGFGVFLLRAIGAGVGSTFWIYVCTRVFRPGNPRNDQIRGLDDIFSGTRQVVDGRIDGSPVRGILTVFLIAFITLVGGIVTIELLKASVYRSRQEERARREALQAKLAAAQGFEDPLYYSQKVAEAKSSACTDEPCVSGYDIYRKVYLDPLTELGYKTDEIMLRYSRPFGRGGGIRHSDEGTRQTLMLLVLNGVCYRKQLLADKLITQETAEVLERAMYRGYYISMKQFDAMCPMRDPDGLEPR